MTEPRISIWPAIRHGFSGRCPNCGKGKLFRAYLKPVDSCTECGEQLARIRADDGPAWLTVLVIGHIVVGIALGVERNLAPPLWISIALFSTMTAALCLAFLPRAKGLFIGAIWAMKPPGSGVD